MQYTVLSPWAETDNSNACALNPRLTTLDGKTIGMFSHFKGHSPYILREIEKELIKKYPNAKFSYLQYPKDTQEIINDKEFQPVFKKWLSEVDGVIGAYGDAGSCAMYHAFNNAYVEQCGKPTVMLTKHDILMSAQCGASARHVPHLRFVCCSLQDLSFEKALDDPLINNVIRPAVLPCIQGLIDGLTKPLTKQEALLPTDEASKYSKETYTGTLDEINAKFYQMGYTNGQPIIPPTKEAVDEMLTGTDLDRNTVIAELPPMLGKATVEKIAINAVMAGCLPTYLPVLIAAVKAMDDPKIHLVGWTCSVAGFAPLLMVNGPIRKQIGLNCNNNFMTPYFKANTAIATAFAYIVMNISGVRPTHEDNAYTGHEGRFGTCFGEDEENSPWEAYQTEHGINANDSALTLCYSHHRQYVGGGKDSADELNKMLQLDDIGAFDPGCTYVISAQWAKILNDSGMKRKDVAVYISEYARKLFGNSPVRWMTDNNHMPKYVPLPNKDPSVYCRKFWSTDHLQIFVAGASESARCLALAGGGDHGGPACVKIDLPKNWDALIKKYSPQAKLPDYIDY